MKPVCLQTIPLPPNMCEFNDNSFAKQKQNTQNIKLNTDETTTL